MGNVAALSKQWVTHQQTTTTAIAAWYVDIHRHLGVGECGSPTVAYPLNSEGWCTSAHSPGNVVTAPLGLGEGEWGYISPTS